MSFFVSVVLSPVVCGGEQPPEPGEGRNGADSAAASPRRQHPPPSLNNHRAPPRRHVTGEAPPGQRPIGRRGGGRRLVGAAFSLPLFPPPSPPPRCPPSPREGGESRDFREPVRKGHKQNKPRSRMEGPGRSARGGAPC